MSSKVAVIGEVFSPNLGDGVIADCMGLLVERAGAEPVHVDLSGKSEWSDSYTIRTAGMAPVVRRAARAMIPTSVRASMREREWLRGTHNDLAARVASASRECDAAIIGGGQLLIDNMLRFPMKIRSACAGLRDSGITKVAILGCGVGHQWSGRAKSILNEAFESMDLVWVGVRDPKSCDVIRGVLPNHSDRAHWSTDVAVWSDEAYKLAPADPDSDRTLVGIGIIDPRNALGKIVSDDDPRITKLIDGWVRVIRGLEARGHKVALFSNGDPEDHGFAERIAGSCASAELKARPERPDQLVGQIAGFGSVIAHRLHANIIAYALRVPSLPLVWDKKVEGFAKITDRADLCLQRENQSPDEILAAHSRVLERGFSIDNWTSNREHTTSHVREVIDLLTT